MASARDRAVPALPPGSVVVWDNARLDQALALGDVHKRYMAEGLAAFPASARTGVESTLGAHFAQLVVDLTAEEDEMMRALIADRA